MEGAPSGVNEHLFWVSDHEQYNWSSALISVLVHDDFDVFVVQFGLLAVVDALTGRGDLHATSASDHEQYSLFSSMDPKQVSLLFCTLQPVRGSAPDMLDSVDDSADVADADAVDDNGVDDDVDVDVDVDTVGVKVKCCSASLVKGISAPT